MERRFDTVRLVAWVPDTVRNLNPRNLPVYEAGTVRVGGVVAKFFFAGILLMLAIGMFALVVVEPGSLGTTLIRLLVGAGLTWAFWAIVNSVRKNRKIRAEVDRAYREASDQCQARVIHFEIRDPREDTSTFYLYYQFRDDFMVQEELDDRTLRKRAHTGETVTVQYLRRDPRVARLYLPD